MPMTRALEIYSISNWDQAEDAFRRLRALLEPQGFKLNSGDIRLMRKQDGRYLAMATMNLSCEGKSKMTWRGRTINGSTKKRT